MISLDDALRWAERDLGRMCVAEGFDQREVGSVVVNVLYYACAHADPNLPVEHRFKMFLRGEPATGGFIR